MGQLTHFGGNSTMSTPTKHALGGGEEDTGVMVGVGGAYHTEAAWDRFAVVSLPGRVGDLPGDEQSVFSLRGAEAATHIGRRNAEEALVKARLELQQLSARLVTIQEWERQRIAADLHDGIGQSLSVIKLTIEAAIGQISLGTHVEAADALYQLSHKVKDTIADLRRTVMDLRPPMLDDFGLLPTLSWFFREFETVWANRKFEKIISVQESDVPAPLKTVIFRVLQEAVNNTVKHAHADWLRVNLTMVDGALVFSIEDNGQGFDPAAVSNRPAGRGFGLVTMLERARSSNGALEVKSAPGCGTRISISWPSATGHGAALARRRL